MRPSVRHPFPSVSPGAQAALILFLCLLGSLPAPAAPVDLRPLDCRPGGEEIDSLSLRAPGEDDPALVLRGARVVGSITTATLCGEEGAPGPGPCLLRGEEPTVLASLVVEGGLDLSGAILAGGLDLTCTDLRGDLDLRGAQVLGPLILAGARIGGSVHLDDTLVTGPVSGRQLRADGGLGGAGTRLIDTVDLTSADLRGAVVLEAATVGALGLGESELRRGLRATGTAFLGGLDLSVANVGRELTFTDVRFADDLELFDVRLEGPLILDGVLLEGDLDLAGRFQGEVLLRGLRLTGDADALEAILDGGLVVEDSLLAGMLDLSESRVGGSLKISDTELLDEVDLSEGRFRRSVSFLRCRLEGGIFAEEADFATSPEFVGCEPEGVGLGFAGIAGGESADE